MRFFRYFFTPYIYCRFIVALAVVSAVLLLFFVLCFLYRRLVPTKLAAAKILHHGLCPNSQVKNCFEVWANILKDGLMNGWSDRQTNTPNGYGFCSFCTLVVEFILRVFILLNNVQMGMGKARFSFTPPEFRQYLLFISRFSVWFCWRSIDFAIGHSRKYRWPREDGTHGNPLQNQPHAHA